MVESAGGDRVDQIVLRDMYDAMAVYARPGTLARTRRADEDDQTGEGDRVIWSHLTKSGSRGSEGSRPSAGLQFTTPARIACNCRAPSVRDAGPGWRI